jgi:Methylamine utilisation protein MauE
VTRLRLALRLFLGLVLLASAAGKLLDVEGFARILGTYEAFPEAALRPLALTVPLVELALALWLFSGRRLAAAAVSALALHIVYGAWAAATLLRGLRIPNCGCFGVFLAQPLGWTTVFEDLVMVGLSAWLIALARRRP